MKYKCICIILKKINKTVKSIWQNGNLETISLQSRRNYTGIPAILGKDFFSPLHCFVILSTQKIICEKWINSACVLARNSPRRELVARKNGCIYKEYKLGYSLESLLTLYDSLEIQQGQKILLSNNYTRLRLIHDWEGKHKEGGKCFKIQCSFFFLSKYIFINTSNLDIVLDSF